jgi:hypothetical protein
VLEEGDYKSGELARYQSDNLISTTSYQSANNDKLTSPLSTTPSQRFKQVRKYHELPGRQLVFASLEEKSKDQIQQEKWEARRVMKAKRAAEAATAAKRAARPAVAREPDQTVRSGRVVASEIEAPNMLVNVV